jgi:hypothetical protein
MLLESLDVDVGELQRRTGWVIKPEGACKDDVCVPLPVQPVDGRLDIRVFAERVGMPLVDDDAHQLWAMGPAAGGRVLETARCPELTLPDQHGRPFSLSSLHGQKVMLLAWASW